MYAGEQQSGWVTHNDPKGFTVTHPAGWAVETQGEGRIIVRSPYPAMFVFIHPFVQQGDGGAEAWVLKVGTTYSDIFPSALTHQPARRQPSGELIGELIFHGGNQPAKANYLCIADGPTGMFYAIAAPMAVFADWRPALVYILQSLRFTTPAEAASSASGAEPDWVRFVDPMDQAFDLEVPRGWQVSGGLFRAGTMDVRPEVRASAPDGSIHIFSGDRNIPTFALPTDIGMSLGFVEGSPYNPAGTGQMMIYNYRPGAYFAQEYVQTTLGRQFGGIQITGGQDRHDLTMQANQGLTPGYQQANVGEVTFVANAGGRPMRGYCFCHTIITGAQMGAGIWNVHLLYGYLAQPEQEQTARAYLDRMVKSSHVSPQWSASQQQLSTQSSQVARQHQQWMGQQQQKAYQTMQETSDIINQSYWDRQRSQDERNRHFGNYIMDQTDVRDERTGEEWRVSSGSNYYWRKTGTDVVVGTNTYQRPDIDFTPLKEF
jgi:hypothetical protein